MTRYTFSDTLYDDVSDDRHAPAPGAPGGESAGEGPTPSTTVHDDGPTLDTRSWPDKRQNTRVSGDTAQHRMTLGTACGIPYPKTKQKPIDFFLINSGMEPPQRINLVYAWNNSPNLANNQNTTQLLHASYTFPQGHPPPPHPSPALSAL